MYSSITTWKLVPPKPKALTPARRTPSLLGSHSRSSVFTRRGDESKSIPGLGFVKFTVGGNTFSWSAMATTLPTPS